MLNVPLFYVGSISDGLEQVADDEMQVTDADCASDGSIKFIIDDTEIYDVRCILILDTQFDVVSVWVDDENDVERGRNECFIVVDVVFVVYGFGVITVDDDAIDVADCDVDVDDVVIDLMLISMLMMISVTFWR